MVCTVLEMRPGASSMLHNALIELHVYSVLSYFCNFSYFSYGFDLDDLGHIL